MQYIFRCDGFAADAAFCKSDIFGNRFIQMMADHQHIKMFFDRVDGKGAGWVGGGGQHIVFPANPDNIGGMTAASAFGVEGMDGAPFHGGKRMLDKS